MTLPQKVFLKHVSGDSLGPLPLQSVEVLFDAKIVDEGTPLSLDGSDFKPVREWPDVLIRLIDIREQAALGNDPWANPAPSVDLHATVSVDLPQLQGGGGVLAKALGAAAGKATGKLRVIRSDGEVMASIKDGKIVVVASTVPALQLAPFLEKAGVADAAALEKGKAQAPAMGGDLGGALIALGLIQPHIYFEQMVNWALSVLGSAFYEPQQSAVFEPAEVPNPAVPLGFDRFGVLTEAVRKGIPKTFFVEEMMKKKSRPLIISQVEGVTFEDCKLQARELRALNAVDGVKTLSALLELAGAGGEENQIQVMRAVYFATECGFVVFGDDPLLKQELAETAELEKVFAKMQDTHFFDLLGITEKSSDDAVRTRYADLAKKYHPDTVRSEAHPALREIKGKIFGLISQANNEMSTEKARYDYAQELSQGRIGNSQDLQKAQDILQAETLYKKAEILVKVRKYEEAMEHVDRAIVLNSNDTEFKILRVYVGYLVASKNGVKEDLAGEAIKKILGLMKNEPNIANGYLWLAHLNRAFGKPEVSLKYYEKVLEFDKHHVEASRELRAANMRKDKEKKKKWPF